MGKHVVFLLHGMGTPGNGWEKEPLKELKANLKAIKFPRNLDNDFEFKPINYDQVFQSYIKAHNMNAKSMKGLGGNAGLSRASPIFRELFRYAMRSHSSEKFIVGALGDVFLYRRADYAKEVQNHIVKEITSYLDSKPIKPQWSVIAYSLGTRVVHDALDMFFEDATNRTIYKKPVMLAMIANVTHLLAYSPSKLWKDTRVFPSKVNWKGACYRYVNALHPADPFTWIREFDPTPDWGGNAEYNGQYREPVIKFKEITQLNTHSFSGYLKHPQVAAAICWGLGPGNTLKPVYDEGALATRLGNYAKKTLKGNVEHVFDKARTLRNERDFTAFEEAVSAIADFEKYLRKFGDSLFN